MEGPEVRYAKSGDVNIAYAVLGDGPFDLVFVSGWVLSSLEFAWEGPPADFFRQLASFSRLILFDKRGTGLSDRTTGIPDLETRMDDIRAVMDAVGSKRAAIVGFSEGGPMTLLFAATYPQRTAAAVLYGCGASYLRAEDYPWGLTPQEWAEDIRKWAARAGSEEWVQERLEFFAPSIARDEGVRRWWRRWVLGSASPGAAVDLRRMNAEIDARHTLPAIRVPTLLLYRVGDHDYPEEGRYIADRIPGAELIGPTPGRRVRRTGHGDLTASEAPTLPHAPAPANATVPQGALRQMLQDLTGLSPEALREAIRAAKGLDDRATGRTEVPNQSRRKEAFLFLKGLES
ncbi:MAG TPA: alpha/beta hydrolase [Actinomycetota bacterium]|nr:alpha/beta hydrolase [Actinomycetota bacterium]